MSNSNDDRRDRLRNPEEIDDFLDEENVEYDPDFPEHDDAPGDTTGDGAGGEDSSGPSTAKKAVRKTVAVGGLGYGVMRRPTRLVAKVFMPGVGKLIIGTADDSILGANDGKGRAVRYDRNGERHLISANNLSRWEESHPGFTEHPTNPQDVQSRSMTPQAERARRGNALDGTDDPVNAAQKQAQRRKLTAAAAMMPKAEKSRSGGGGKKGKGKKAGVKGEFSSGTAGGVGGDSSSSSSTTSSSDSGMSRMQKEIIGILTGLLALALCVLIFVPTSMGMGGGDAESIAPVLGGVAGSEDEQEQEDAEAAAVNQGGGSDTQCYAADVDDDSALNATGGALFEPGDSDAVATVAGMDSTQVMHAQEAIAVGKEMGIKPAGLKIALMVESAETGFRNYANNGKGENGPLKADQDPVELAKSQDSPFSEGLPPGHGGDHGSAGVFQQQFPWWGDGTIESLMNPRSAARWFYEAMLEKAPDYESQEPATVSQTVQGSAFASGDNYRAKVQEADALYDKIKDTAAGFNWNRYNGYGADPKPDGVDDKAFGVSSDSAEDYTLARGGDTLILAQDEEGTGDDQEDTRSSGASPDDLAPSDGSSSDGPCADVPSTAGAGSPSGADIVDRNRNEEDDF